ncbi:MAG: beta-N-acetylhexosaminidase [Armatimonadota bacterium]|nr:beta-N-acetylhexosaminidase [Armatimonadota bacterium]MDR7450754.1 beta-N-acetylhexosaminidase [Armatimonadota bacterium]MDR7466110.1 beta-N-acetylhexosaminidase [Armatimonadota bacterium]MDR7493853.1 beta-N-acetylhexosaminidase [Armatimonadota bacterium]MDR7498986.1 beta-N-acetylhexosaminidase [Armatimonadota bacterium]
MPGCSPPARRRGIVLLLLILAAAAGSPAVGAPGRAVPDAYLPAPASGDLLPVPKEATIGRGSFALSSATRIVVADGATDEDLFAARELNEELRAMGAPALQVVREREVSGPDGHVLIGQNSAHALLRRALGDAAPVARPEGYLLRVTPSAVVVAGADRRGTFYGAQTLRQLLRRGAGRSIPEAVIRDWPDHPIRAVHLLLDNASDPFHIDLIDRILAPYKFNTIVAEAEHVQWESGRPWWRPDSRGATKAQVRRLLEAAREHHIQVIPLVATLGHSEWVFAGLQDETLCPRLAYSPRGEVTCDRGRGVFPAVYDPTRQFTVEGRTTTLNEALIVPVLKEAVDLFRPQYLHLGHDEVRGPSGLRYEMALYLRDVIALAGELRALNVRPMIWGDVLWERRAEATAQPQYRDLPPDLVIVPWKYEEVRDYPELAYFRQAGFDVLGATWYRTANNHFFSRAARAAGALGMIRTTWTGSFQNRAALGRAYQQLYTYLTAATYFWTADRPAPDRAPSDGELSRRFADAWTRGTSVPEQSSGTLLDLSPVANQRHIDDDGKGWLGKGRDYDLRALRPGRRRLGGVLFEVLDPARNRGRSIIMLRGERDVAASLPERVTVRFGGRAACLVFLHTTLDRAVTFGEVVGRYTMVLADGRRVALELRYGQNISSWLADAERGIPSIEQEVAWTGRTVAGNDVLLTMVRWKHPQPEVPVQSIELASAGGRASPAVFAITALDRCP